MDIVKRLEALQIKKVVISPEAIAIVKNVKGLVEMVVTAVEENKYGEKDGIPELLRYEELVWEYQYYYNPREEVYELKID